MQFTLRSMFLIVTGLALFCGVIFSLPVMATSLVLAFTLLLSPAVWVSGASFATEGRQAFFRGGLICGILPFVVSGYGLSMYVGGVVAPLYSLSSVQRTYYPVAAAYQGPIYATPPASYNSSGPTDPSDTAANPDGSTPSEVATPTFVEDTTPPPNTSPQTAYVTEAVSVLPFVPYLPTAQIPSPATPAYAETLLMRLTLAAIWLAPGFFSFCGGAISYGTYRLVRPAPPAADSRLGMGDYLVVQGRLTTVSPTSASAGSE